MFDIIIQGFILVLSAAAVWLLNRKEEWSKFGYVFGLMGQPFWAYTTIVNKQWGLLALTIFYTYCWGMGIYNHWIKDEREDSEK